MPTRADTLDMLIARERGWHDLTMLRLLGHPRLPQVFPDFLIGIYHAMRTAGALMDAARLRSIALAPECPVAARLASYWALHVEEERGHDRWMLEDLQHLGIDTARALERPPAREVAEMMGTLHFWVLHTHPVAALAYFYVLERNPPSRTMIDWMARAAGVPRSGLRTFDRHADIDVAHGRELGELLDALPLTPALAELLALSATTVLGHLARIVERLVERADSVPPGPPAFRLSPAARH